MAAVTFSWGVTLAVKKEVAGDKEGTAEKRGKRWGICIRQVAIQVETRKESFIRAKKDVITDKKGGMKNAEEKRKLSTRKWRFEKIYVNL